MIRPIEGGVEIVLRVQPRASATEVAGAYGDRAVRVRVAAPPVDGAANDAVVDLFCELFGLPRRNVELVRGHGSRDKVIRLLGPGLPAARRRLGLPEPG